MKKLILYTFIFFTFFGIAIRVSLADSVSLGISPSVVNIIAKPGTTPAFHLSVKNSGDPVLVTFIAFPSKPIDSFGHMALDQSQKTPVKFSIESSGTTKGTPFLLRTGADINVNVSMNIDKDAVEKDYSFAVLAQTTPFPGPEGQTNVQLAEQLGTNVLLTVTQSGQTEKKASTALFNMLPTPVGSLKVHFHDSFQKIPYILILKNNGRNRIEPSIIISIKGWNIEKKYRLSPQTILSGSQRTFTGSMTGFFMGTYTASASISNGEGTKAVVSTTTFTAYPFIAIFIGAFLFLGILSFRNRRLKQ